MAITAGTVVTAAVDDSTISNTVDCTGYNFLVVCVGFGDTANTLSSLTFNGDALTKRETADTGVDSVSEIWTLASPDQGAYTLSGTASSGSPDMSFVAIPLSGVSGIDTTATTTGETANPSIAITIGATGAYTIGNLVWDHGADDSVDASGSQTELADFNGGSGAGDYKHNAAGKTHSATGATNLTWVNNDGSRIFALTAISLLTTSSTTVAVNSDAAQMASHAVTVYAPANVLIDVASDEMQMTSHAVSTDIPQPVTVAINSDAMTTTSHAVTVDTSTTTVNISSNNAPMTLHDMIVYIDENASTSWDDLDLSEVILDDTGVTAANYNDDAGESASYSDYSPPETEY